MHFPRNSLTTTAESPRQSGCTQQLGNFVVPCEMAAADGELLRWAKRYFKCPECDARPMPRTRPAAALPKCHRFYQVRGIDTMEVRNPLDRENLQKSHVICQTRYHQGARRQDMIATETFSTVRRFWLKHYDSMEVLIMDQGTEFGADFQHLCQSRGILPVVTDSETPWQTSVVEPRALSKWHSRKRAVWKLRRRRPKSMS